MVQILNHKERVLYLSTNTELLLNKWLSIKIQDIKGIDANIHLDVTHNNIFTSTCTEDLT